MEKAVVYKNALQSLSDALEDRDLLGQFSNFLAVAQKCDMASSSSVIETSQHLSAFIPLIQRAKACIAHSEEIILILSSNERH